LLIRDAFSGFVWYFNGIARRACIFTCSLQATAESAATSLQIPCSLQARL
jgi:hypothetical protein